MHAFALVLILLSFKASALILPEAYLSGPEVCAKHTRSKEREIWLQVPVDYQDESKGVTPLYAWTKKTFDPQKKTMIFVSGGPGDTAHHSHLSLSDWNVVFFDQRGNSCSRPMTRELYLTPSFYSSENTTRDIDEIRKHLKLAQISVYGVSYGTVPAHLYGHFFPNSTRAIVLEGIIYQGGETLMRPVERTQMLQDFFDTLPENTQERILELSHHPEVKSNWFSNVGMKMLYQDNAHEVLNIFLSNIIWNEELFVTLMKSFEETNPKDSEFGFGNVMMGMIGCQELGMNLSKASFYSIFHNKKLISDNKNLQQQHYCQDLGFLPDTPTELYNASQKPSLAKTTYFQGTLDGATVKGSAIKHFNQATRGFAQLILIDKAGHLPVYGTIASGYGKGEDLELRNLALAKALNGEIIPKPLLDQLSYLSVLKWTQTLKSTPDL